MLIKRERRRAKRGARRSFLLKLVCSVILLSFPFIFVREAHAWSFFNTKKDEDSNSAELGERIETQFDRFPEEVSSSKSTTTNNNEDDDLKDDGEDNQIRMNSKERRKQERREKKRLKKLERKEEKKMKEEKRKEEEKKIREGESPAGSLHEAIDDDDFDELEDLLKWKPNLKEACKRIGQTKDFTPIMKAAHLGRAKMIDLLLDYGANPNEIDSIGYSALMRAVMSKNVESVKVLVEAGAIVTYVQKTPASGLFCGTKKTDKFLPPDLKTRRMYHHSSAKIRNSLCAEQRRAP